MIVSTEIFCAHYESPLGLMEITGNENGISSLSFVEHPSEQLAGSHPMLTECITQLSEYFVGTRREFDIKLNLAGTEFQKLVWQMVGRVPYGRTVTYVDIAYKIGEEISSTRAVGGANSKNPAAILVPCHRVMGSNGQLTGYAWGTWRKKWLLEHERNFTYGKQTELF